MKRLRVDRIRIDRNSFKKGFAEIKSEELKRETPLWPSVIQTYTTQLMLNKNVNFYKMFYAEWDTETKKGE